MRKNFLLLVILSLLASSLPAQQSADYVIVTSISDTSDAWYAPVAALKAHRNATVIGFDPNNVMGLLMPLLGLQPHYVAVVVRPEELHINFVRKFLMMSTQLDTDPFSDFSYGYITGATATDALNFVNTIIQAEAQNVVQFPLRFGGCAASSLNFVYTSAGDFKQYLGYSSYADIYMETNDNGTGVDFFLNNSASLMNNKLLDIGHNGDPHMIWLFEGGNTSPNPPVWLYDSTRIEDTAYARVGVSSYHLAGLNLYPAVAYNGACHSGEPKKVLVEGDIAATFGDTQWTDRFYTMSDDFSFCLSMLKTGITGYFAPCGANNANDQGEEVYNTFLFHEPLGDIHKRTVDGVVMGFLGNRPNLKIYTEGAPSYGSDILPSGSFDPDDYSGAYSMLGGKANRIYFGDPLYNPFQLNFSDSLNITRAVLDSVNNSTLDVQVRFRKPDVYTAWFPVWDKFHFSNTRIYIPVEMPAWVGDINEVAVLDSSAPYDLAFHAVEKWDGKTIVHFEVDIPDDMYEAIDYLITFRLNFQPLGVQTSGQTQTTVSVFPNPAGDWAVFNFGRCWEREGSLRITDLNGHLIHQVNGIRGNEVRVDLHDIAPGLYVYQLQPPDELPVQGKIVIQ